MIKFIKYYLILLIFSANSFAYGFAEFNQNIQAKIPSGINIQAVNSNFATGIINAENGNITSPFAEFQLRTNKRTMYNYDFILTAKLNTLSGEANAYHYDGNTMYLILANTNKVPPLSSINDIKSGSPKKENNENAIAYSVSNEYPYFYSMEAINDLKYDGLCYRLLSFWYKASLKQTLNPIPYSNTYSTNDKAGSYQATLTLTAIRRF